MKTFGEYIEKERIKSGASVAGIAAEVGVSKQSFFNWRDNVKTPNTKVFLKLAVALELDSKQIHELLELAGQHDGKTTGKSNVKINN